MVNHDMSTEGFKVIRQNMVRYCSFLVFMTNTYMCAHIQEEIVLQGPCGVSDVRVVNSYPSKVSSRPRCCLFCSDVFAQRQLHVQVVSHCLIAQTRKVFGSIFCNNGLIRLNFCSSLYSFCLSWNHFTKHFCSFVDAQTRFFFFLAFIACANLYSAASVNLRLGYIWVSLQIASTRVVA